MVELLAPAGNWASLRAAIKAGADAIFFGVGKLNMRAHGADNFNLEELDEIVKVCRKAGVKGYLTVNTIIYGKDIEEMRRIVDAALEAGIDAVIAMDFSVLEYCNKIGMSVHASTQLNVSNIEAVRFFSKFCDVIVLARELSLKDIKDICGKIKEEDIRGPNGALVKVEVFVHGALCISISGKCYMSLAKHGKSANCGECYQSCRRAYLVIDEETGDELVLDNKYVMSPSDLCTLEIIDRILAAGVEVLKIEGRARKADYVYTVVKVYKEAVKSYENGEFNSEKIGAWMKELESVFNRGFWKGGYYLGEKIDEWSGAKGSKATKEKIEIGRVGHFFDKKGVAVLELKGDLGEGDEVVILGPTTGVVQCKVKEVFQFGKKIEGRVAGEDVTIFVGEKVREKDKIFLLRERKV